MEGWKEKERGCMRAHILVHEKQSRSEGRLKGAGLNVCIGVRAWVCVP